MAIAAEETLGSIAFAVSLDGHIPCHGNKASMCALEGKGLDRLRRRRPFWSNEALLRWEKAFTWFSLAVWFWPFFVWI